MRMRMFAGAVLVVALLSGMPAALAQQPPAVPPQVVGRVLTLDEAVAIALEHQPNIHVRLAEYAAAAYRVDQALTPLLPQVGASVTDARTQSVGTTATGPAIRSFDDATSA